MSQRKKLSRGQVRRTGPPARRVPHNKPFHPPTGQFKLNDAHLNDVEQLKFIYAMWVQSHPVGGKQMTFLENALKFVRFS